MKEYSYPRVKQKITFEDFSDLSDSDSDLSDQDLQESESNSDSEKDLDRVKQKGKRIKGKECDNRTVNRDNSGKTLSTFKNGTKDPINSNSKITSSEQICEKFRVTGSKVSFDCSKCQKGFQYLKSLVNHEKICGKTFKCSSCSKVFKRKDTLEKHRKNIHTEIQCTYDNCEQTFGTKNKLKSHIKQIHRGNFSCKHCEHVFKSSVSLRNHKYRNHSKNKTKTVVRITPLKCQSCPKTFTSSQGLNRHQRTSHV